MKEKEELRREFENLSPPSRSFGNLRSVNETVSWDYRNAIFDYFYSQLESKQRECDHHYKIIPGDEVNSFLAIILRTLDESKTVALRDALIERTPPLKEIAELQERLRAADQQIENMTTGGPF